MVTYMNDLDAKLNDFAAERGWGKFHAPKNLAIGLSVEASELLELFTWLSEDESRSLSPRTLERVKEEVGDVTIQLLNFCRALGLDPIDCGHRKLELNRLKYPVDKAFGSARKYDEL